MSFTTITYNFYCTVSVFILSGYPRSVGVESKTRTYNAHTQRPCTLINLGATCTSYSHAHYQLWYLYIIWRTLFWYWSVYKETTVSHHRSIESASPIDIILLLCVFWVHWRAQWKKGTTAGGASHLFLSMFAFRALYVLPYVAPNSCLYSISKGRGTRTLMVFEAHLQQLQRIT